ncbi:putative bifunctional diguanylate cyclase/phosphodiesterase [Cohnella sp. JJ-181]|uniref:putative bifunctional diguanylate cyclase/phosphodiesterase n=1 Tax=Cohnella rhizoplanae TaxID=2974897 RepID=UPI0022FF9152|nr:bifunctional diguanylate cyclase/phosphodiesterase [Cohnella sp. JJ-181]CAI6082120.1 hypothetical protein COHCIP112018_03536 [Cohnella sp. JJ-181]
MDDWSAAALFAASLAAVLLVVAAMLLFMLGRERRQSRKIAAEVDADWMNLLRESPISLTIINRSGVVENISRQLLPLLGTTSERVFGLHFRDIMHAGSAGQAADIFKRTLQGEKCVADIKLLRADGAAIEAHVETSPYLRGGEVAGIAVFTQDNSDQKRSIERIRYMAYYDDMTGLPNRRFFMNRLSERMQAADGSGSRIAVWYMDIDRFKLVNASYGRDFGDMLLLQVAERLTRWFPDTENIARAEGDEFIGMFEGFERDEQAIAQIQGLMKQFEAPFELGGVMIHVTVSIGLATRDGDPTGADGLLKRADTALHRLKENGRNGCLLYDPAFENTALHKLTLQHELVEAMNRRQFLLYYQPQYDLRSGGLVGFEALIRWRHPERGMVPPSHFIPAAEESGLIMALGDWVLLEACRQNRDWQLAGLPAYPISVNLSIRQFAQPNLVGRIAEILDQTDLAAPYLKLEITESIAMDVERATAILESLSDLGVGISVDDFGTGYSSFSYLKRLPIDCLKIDRSFVRDIHQDPNDRAIVAAIIAMAHNLQIGVIAEGVETEEQVLFLQQHACDEMQGYYGSPPLPAEEIADLLNRDHGLPAITALDNNNAAAL